MIQPLRSGRLALPLLFFLRLRGQHNDGDELIFRHTPEMRYQFDAVHSSMPSTSGMLRSVITITTFLLPAYRGRLCRFLRADIVSGILHGKRYQLPHRGGIVHSKERFNLIKHPSLLFNSINFLGIVARN
jgi:hypothetical protein